VPVKIRYEKFNDKVITIKKIIESSNLAKEKQQQFLGIIKGRISSLKIS